MDYVWRYLRQVASYGGIVFTILANLKWRARATVEDSQMGPHTYRTVLTPRDEDMICALRRKTWLSLDDCYLALKPSIPKLSRSNLHRCLVRHGLSVIPKDEAAAQKPEHQPFKSYDIGFFHIDICEVRAAQGKGYLYVAVDRVCKFIFVQMKTSPTIAAAIDFVKDLTKAVPYKIHRILTDNGAQFTYNLLLDHLKPKHDHPFDAACKALGIAHKTTQFRHPWTNGQVERANRTLKDATVKIYHYDTLEQLSSHLNDFLKAYNFQRKLKALKFLSPYDKIIQIYNDKPDLFLVNPNHFLSGLNT